MFLLLFLSIAKGDASRAKLNQKRKALYSLFLKSGKKCIKVEYITLYIRLTQSQVCICFSCCFSFLTKGDNSRAKLNEKKMPFTLCFKKVQRRKICFKVEYITLYIRLTQKLSMYMFLLFCPFLAKGDSSSKGKTKLDKKSPFLTAS